MKKNNIKLVFIPITKASIKNMEKNEIDNQPPKNIITVNKLIKIIEPYSAKKNNAKPILEYSTLKPETNSDSASGKSKGARLVSANIEIKNIKNNEKNGMQKNVKFWKITISIKFNEPTQINNVINIKPIDIS
jgi:hypothetical protein